MAMVERKVSYARQVGRIRGRVSDVHFPNLDLPYLAFFASFRPHNSY